jgi:hypothetical protein
MVIIRGRGRGTNYSNGLDLRYFHNHRKNIIIFLLEFGPRQATSFHFIHSYEAGFY